MTPNAEAGGMPRRQYQLVLAGELMPGHDLEQAVAALAQVFTASPTQLRALFDGASHRVQQSFNADDALELQERLQHVGVRARIEKVAGPEVPLVLREGTVPARPAPPGEASVVRAASVPHQPTQATAPPRPPMPPAAEPATRTRGGHAEQRWRDAWADSHVVDEPDEESRLALFVGPSGPRYVKRFARVRQANRPVPRPTWNWGAVLSPFLWAMYRKLWGWALVIGLTEVVIPLLLLILPQYGLLPERFILVAWFSVVANRLFWPAVADYLYFRHVHFSLIQLFRLSPGYASDLDIASGGGVSRGAVLVGVAFSGVLALLMWSLVSSLGPDEGDAFEARVSELAAHTDLATVPTPGEFADNAQRDLQEENRWSATRRKLRELGQVVSVWMSSQAVNRDPTQLTLFRLREEMGVPAQALADGWGNEIHYLPDSEGYRLISAGPDQLFGTADDIMYRRVLAR